MATEAKKRGSIILRIVLVVFAIWMIYYLGSLIRQYSSLQNEYEKITAEKNEKTLILKEKSKLLETGDDADFIERAAREKLGNVYPDEHFYIDISGDWLFIVLGLNFEG